MKSFRPAKGWKKEFEEISLGAVIVTLLIAGSSAAVSAAGTGSSSGGGMTPFYGRVTAFIVCTSDAAVGSNPCKRSGLQAPYYEVYTSNPRFQLIGMIPYLSRGIAKVPIPSHWVIGLGQNAGNYFLPTIFWMY